MKSGMPMQRPQLGLEELHQLRWLLGCALTLLSAWTMFYLEIDAWVLMGVITAATWAVLIWPQLPAKVPAFVHTFAFPLIVAFFLGDVWLKGDALPAIVRLDMLLLLYRGISYRQRREDLQIIVLGLFLIVVAGVLTVSIAFALQLLAFAGCALALLLVLTLLQAMEDPATTAPKVANPRALPSWVVGMRWMRLFMRLRQATDWRVVLLGGVLFAGVVGLSAVLFISIPRFQLENSLFLERFVLRKARTGFSDSIKFGDVTEIRQDTSVALSVDVADHSLVPASPYWRMLILDQYENGTFRLSSQLRATFAKEQTAMTVDGTARTGRSVYWTFYLESQVSRYLPVLGAFSGLHFTELQNFQFSPTMGVVALRDEPAKMTAYRVERFDDSTALRDRTFADLWRSREKPALKPLSSLYQIGLGGLEAADQRLLVQTAEEVSSFPAAIVPPEQPAEDFSARAIAWLRGNHGYSLSPRVPGGPGDPLMRWMLSKEPGHCELFAGSLVLLARAAGFPARVVTGFHGGSWNSYSGNLTVRNSDAHAWAEIFDETRGIWIRADALAAPVTEKQTANAGEESAGRVRQIDRGWSARVESLRIFWYRQIVSFDRRAQVETLKAIKETTQDSGRHMRELAASLLARAKAWWLAPWDAHRLLWVALLLMTGGAVAWAWQEFGSTYWRRWISRGRERTADPVRRDAGRWLTKLAISETAEGEKAAVVAELQRLRFGARPSWPEPKRVFRRARRVARQGGRRPAKVEQTVGS